MTASDFVALYARVSSESQARDNTIASQVTALRERIAADGFQLKRATVNKHSGCARASANHCGHD